MKIEQKSPINFYDALDNFEFLEHNLDLPRWTIGDVFIWKIIRKEMFTHYCQSIDLTNHPHPELIRLEVPKIKRGLSALWPMINKNPFLKCSHPIKRIIIPSTRKKNICGRMVDPLSYRVWSDNNEIESLIFDVKSPLDPYPLKSPSSYQMDVLLLLAWMTQRTIPVRLSNNDHLLITEISNNLNLNKSVLKEKIVSKIKIFKSQQRVFFKLFKKLNPSYLYVANSQGFTSVISSAQKLCIPVIEFQHGVFSKGHMSYDFKEWDNVPYFPDKILAFGKDWFDNISFPSKCDIHIIGSLYVENQIKEATNTVTRNDHQLLLLTQGTISEKLLFHISDFHRLRPDWKIIVRPHPNERSEHIQDSLDHKIKHKTNNIVVDKITPLFEQAAASSVAVGVNSTALVEAMMAGCKVAMINEKGGAKYFKKLIDDGYAVYMNNGQELADSIDYLPQGNARGYYAHPVEDIVSVVEGSG